MFRRRLISLSDAVESGTGRGLRRRLRPGASVRSTPLLFLLRRRPRLSSRRPTDCGVFVLLCRRRREDAAAAAAVASGTSAAARVHSGSSTFAVLRSTQLPPSIGHSGGVDDVQRDDAVHIRGSRPSTG